METDGNQLRVSDIAEINAVNASTFRDEVCKAMPSKIEALDIDLSQTRFVDNTGLGALFAIFKAVSRDHDNVRFRLINPRPAIQQLLELTQMHQLFEISQK